MRCRRLSVWRWTQEVDSSRLENRGRERREGRGERGFPRPPFLLEISSASIPSSPSSIRTLSKSEIASEPLPLHALLSSHLMICNVFLWLPLMILSLSFYRAVAEELSDVLDDIKNLILSGQLPRARRLVNACLLRAVGRKNEYHCPSSEDVIQTYKHYSSMLYEEESYLELIRRSMQNNGHNQSKTSSGALQSSCWDGTVSTSNAPFEFNASLSDANRWNECCSFYKTGQKKPPKCFDPTGATSQLCCYFSVGSDNHLALPILKEPYVTIRL